MKALSIYLLRWDYLISGETLNYIDKVSVIIEALYTTHQTEIIETIFEIHALLSYFLLTKTDDFEHNHLNYGFITIPLQNRLDRVFGTLIEKIAPEQLFEFWASQQVFKARIKYQTQKEQFARKKLSDLEGSKFEQEKRIDTGLAQLEKLLTIFQNSSNTTLQDNSDFKEFLSIYEHLKPILIKIHPNFESASFLQTIHENRPLSVLHAIANILEKKDSIKEYLNARIKHQKTFIDEYEKLKKNIDDEQTDIRNENIIHQAIAYQIKKQFQLEIGSHHHYYAKKIIHAFCEQKDTLNNNTLMEALRSEKLQIFQKELNKTINELHENPLQKSIYTILKADHQFDIKLKNEIDLAYRTKSNPPTKYQFVKHDKNKSLGENDIQIRQGYEICDLENFPEESDMTYDHIYLDKTGKFRLKHQNNWIIKGELTQDEQKCEEIDERIKIILKKAQVSNQTLFYQTKKMNSFEPVPEAYIEENKINLEEPLDKLISNLQDYIREFFKYSDPKNHTEEERPCLKQKLKYLNQLRESDRIKEIQEKIDEKLNQNTPLQPLDTLKKVIQYDYNRKTTKYRKEVQYYNQIMFLDDQLTKISGFGNTVYQSKQEDIRNEKTSPQERFYNFSMQFKPQKRSFFFSAENASIDLLSKKIWRGAVIVKNLQSIVNTFQSDEKENIKQLIDLLENNTKPFISLDQRLEHFYDLIAKDSYLEMFLTPKTIFEKILAVFGIPNFKQQFIQNLRKDNHLLNLCMTLRENQDSKTEELKKILLKNETMPSYISQEERLQKFENALDENQTINELFRKKLKECLPIPLKENMQSLIKKNQEEFTAIVTTLSNEQKLTNIVKNMTDSKNDFQAFKKATKELDTLLNGYNPQTSLSYLIGQKTSADVLKDKVKKKLKFFQEAEEIKSSQTPSSKK